MQGNETITIDGITYFIEETLDGSPAVFQADSIEGRHVDTTGRTFPIPVADGVLLLMVRTVKNEVKTKK